MEACSRVGNQVPDYKHLFKPFIKIINSIVASCWSRNINLHDWHIDWLCSKANCNASSIDKVISKHELWCLLGHDKCDPIFSDLKDPAFPFIVIIWPWHFHHGSWFHIYLSCISPVPLSKWWYSLFTCSSPSTIWLKWFSCKDLSHSFPWCKHQALYIPENMAQYHHKWNQQSKSWGFHVIC